MHERALHRAAIVAAVVSVLLAATTFADTIAADGDTATGIQSSIDLGTTVAGSQVEVPVWFELGCKGLAHADRGQVVTIAMTSSLLPAGGSASATSTTIGPVPDGWPADDEGCPSGITLRSAAPALLSLTMPSASGPASFTLLFGRSLSPAGSGDAGAVSGLTAITVSATVVVDQPPTLQLPAPLTVEATGPSGAIVDYTVGVTDAEDDPAPTATCVPASGTGFAMGSTTVDCSATDSAGNAVEGTFTVDVVDTTPPTLAQLPVGATQWTTDPTGVPADYQVPTASDAVDGSVPVDCAPAPGDWLLPGTAVVSCTATDAAGNVATGSFALTVEVGIDPGSDPGSEPGVAPGTDEGNDPSASALLDAEFGPPVGADGVLRANPGRTVPLELRLLADGMPVTDGSAEIRLEDCAGTAVADPLALRFGGGWWRALLRTDGLPACVDGVVVRDGIEAGHLHLVLDAAPSAASHAASPSDAASTGAEAMRTATKDPTAKASTPKAVTPKRADAISPGAKVSGSSKSPPAAPGSDAAHAAGRSDHGGGGPGG